MLIFSISVTRSIKMANQLLHATLLIVCAIRYVCARICAPACMCIYKRVINKGTDVYSSYR